MLLALFTLLTISFTHSSSDFTVAAYLPEWRYEGAHWETIAQHTTHLILFSLEMSNRGEITALERFPRPTLYKEARTATQKYGCKLLVCFGGNGRSSGFSQMTRSAEARKNFLHQLSDFIQKNDLDGVDYNWEYPGYQFGKGYLPDEEVNQDYNGLLNLLKETRELLGKDAAITMSYYPDGKQETILVQKEASKYVDFFHAMAYDHNGQHSTMQHFKDATRQALSIFGTANSKITIGLPFYGRSIQDGDWKSYEDIVQQQTLTPEMNQVGHPTHQYFNGVDLIRQKVRHAMNHNVGGVMIWEVGQDCRVLAKKTGSDIHVVTCPESKSSLLLAITDELTVGAVQNEEKEEL